MQVQNYGDQWHNTNYLFFQEKTGNVGKPIHPDTINGYLDRFSERYDLPHINPHAFRHTMANVLYFKNADKQSAECIANVILRPQTDQYEKKAE